jgi:peptidoglycan/xylan/chitin deacetylase (PgdA/CDA1 family)
MGGGRWLRAGLIAVVFVSVLIATGYAFVLKSFPYQTPQDDPPRMTLTAADAAAFMPYASGLPAIPVLAWRDVSRRKGLLVTTPTEFAIQLATLRRYGYQSVSPGQLAALAAGRPVRLPGRPVLLTFDGGLSTDWTTVDPILRRYGFRALLFVNPNDMAVKSPSYFLTSDEIAAMAVSGRWDIGLELPGGWQQPAQAVASGERARDELAAVTGHPVSAFGWPVLAYPTAAGLREPAATYRALRGQFSLVFGRPDSGAARFVATGSAGPLPRVNVTSHDGVRSLSNRLRSGVPAPVPQNLLSLPWHPAGGRCVLAARSIAVTAKRYAKCTVVANGDRWTGYRLSLLVSGTAGSTAIIDLRDTPAGCLEIAIGRSTVSVKQRIGRTWHRLRSVRAQVPSTVLTLPRSERPAPLIGSGDVEVQIGLAGSTLSLRVRGIVITQRLSTQIGNGLIAFGMAGTGKSAWVTFRHVAVVRNSLPRIPGT